jgi:RNA recognition motif-containing protein
MLYEKFSPYGAILSVKVLSDPQTGQCRGIGFVNYAGGCCGVSC